MLEIRTLGVCKVCDFSHRGLAMMLVCFLSIHYLVILSPQSFYYLESFGLEELRACILNVLGTIIVPYINYSWIRYQEVNTSGGGQIF